MKKKLISVFMSLIIGIFVLTGCNAGNIEGTWVLYEEIEPSGNKLSQSDLEELGISETYVIKGDEVNYTCEMKLLKKPVEIPFILEDLGNNQYNFKMDGGFVFASPKVKGDTMTYEVGEEGNTSTMIFKKQK